MKPLARRTLAALLLIAGYDHSALGMPSFNEVKADFRPSDTLILEPDGGLARFVERLTQINGGRAFFADPQNLGEFVLVDFVEQRRKLLRQR